jgi:hypothetical protein
MKTTLKRFMALAGVIWLLSSFTISADKPGKHFPVVKTYEKDRAGNEIVKTQIILDKHTSRDALIETCSLLGSENVSLTFEELSIRKSFLGLAGKNRIAKLKGQIQLPNGKSAKFKAGGMFNFNVVRITYTQQKDTGEYIIQMVEVID